MSCQLSDLITQPKPSPTCRMLIHLLAATVILLVLPLGTLVSRQHAAINVGNIPWRIMDFICEGGCVMPHEFAACFLSGNRQVTDERFPNFEGSARQRRVEWSAE
jgi:hypothetical protein